VIIITAAADVPRLRAAHEWHANMPLDDASRKSLDRALPELNFRQIPLSDTVDFLRDVTGSNIFVSWRDLEAAGVGRNRPINLQVRNVPLRTCLWLLLEMAQADGKGALDFAVGKDRIITISTSTVLAKSATRPSPQSPQPPPAPAR